MSISYVGTFIRAPKRKHTWFKIMVTKTFIASKTDENLSRIVKMENKLSTYKE